MDVKFVIPMVEYLKKVIIWGGSSGSKQLGGRNGVNNRVLHPGEPYVPNFSSIGRFRTKVC